MKISNVTISIDLEHEYLDLSEQFNAFMTNMYIKTDKLDFPDSKYMAIPTAILRWLLRELRLIASKNNKRRERTIYFYPDINNYISIEYLEDGILSLKFTKRKLHRNKGIIHTMFSKSGFNETEIIYCSYNDLFIKAYEKAEELLIKIEQFDVSDGNSLVLKEELKYSKKIVNKIQKEMKQINKEK